MVMTNEPAPDSWRELVDSGRALLQSGQASQALESLRRAVQMAPDERDARYWLGNALRMTGQGGEAAEEFRRLLAQRPHDLEVSFALAFLLRESGRVAEAASVLLKSSRQAGLGQEQLLQIAGFLRDSNQFEAAIEVCRKALAGAPRQADLHFKLARLYQAGGDFEHSLEALKASLELQPDNGPAWVALAQQKKFEAESDPEFRRIESAAEQSLGEEADTCLAFAYGKVLDDVGRRPEAWRQYSKGNALMARQKAWNARSWNDFVERRLQREARPAGPDSRGRNALFIVGMPRSGTTLLEQMLARHPQITARGELNFLAHFARQRAALGTPNQQQIRQLGDALWAQLRQSGPEQRIYIDKNPLNFRYLDVLFELLPAARVVHLARDGRASCLSCWLQMFEHADMAFTYSFDDLVQFYSGYRRLMAKAERSWPGQILRVEYDALVRSERGVLERVVKFLGLGWDNALLRSGTGGGPIRTASVWQARQPVHTRSVDRWRDYHDFAPDFFDRLAAIDARLEARPQATV